MSSNKNYKYIYPKIDVYKQIITLEDVLLAVGAESDGQSIFCPNNHNKRQKLKFYGQNADRICKCHNCGEVKGDVINVAMWKNGHDFESAMRWLTETFNIQKVLNPDYVSPNGNTISADELKIAQEKLLKIQLENKIALPVVLKTKKIEYLEFDLSIKYNFIKDIKPFLPSGRYWPTFSDEQKLRLIYTWFYNKSFELGSNSPKYNYYRKRAIDTENKWLKRIGYLAVEDFETVLKDALEIFPLDTLELVGLIKIDEKTSEPKLSFNYVRKGGLLLVPSFDLYSNTVTGFMLRPTQPEDWMKERHMKEIQLSNTSIIYPLPFGLTYSSIKNHNEFYITEGHPDALSLPGNVDGQEDRAFFSLPGVNGLSESHLGLLKGKRVILCFDQDDAGKKSAFGYTVIDIEGVKETYICGIDDMKKEHRLKELIDSNKKYMEINYEGVCVKLERANISYEIKSWDKKLGSDVNDVRIYGNINKIF